MWLFCSWYSDVIYECDVFGDDVVGDVCDYREKWIPLASYADVVIGGYVGMWWCLDVYGDVVFVVKYCCVIYNDAVM